MYKNAANSSLANGAQKNNTQIRFSPHFSANENVGRLAADSSHSAVY